MGKKEANHLCSIKSLVLLQHKVIEGFGFYYVPIINMFI